jgi:hypothetical protein
MNVLPTQHPAPSIKTRAASDWFPTCFVREFLHRELYAGTQKIECDLGHRSTLAPKLVRAPNSNDVQNAGREGACHS